MSFKRFCEWHSTNATRDVSDFSSWSLMLTLIWNECNSLDSEPLKWIERRIEKYDFIEWSKKATQKMYGKSYRSICHVSASFFIFSLQTIISPLARSIQCNSYKNNKINNCHLRFFFGQTSKTAIKCFSAGVLSAFEIFSFKRIVLPLLDL